MDALLSAYRVGARVAWRELSSTAVAAGLAAETVARFAELVFAFIDELSAASVAGHTDELATTGRVRQRYLDRLAKQLIAGEPVETLRASAVEADWHPPETLTAVLVAEAQTRGLAARFGQATLQLSEDLPGVDDRNGFGEPRDEDAVMSALMNAEGVTLAKAFRDADSSGKRKLIAALARAVADSKD
jgi:hypothetical protein